MKYYKRLQFILLIFLFLFTKETFPQAGQLDDTFGQGGIVTTAINDDIYESGAYSSVIQDDGKIVVAASSHNGDDNDFTILRYNANGSLDNTFGINGIVTTGIGPANDGANSVALQKDGKMVAAGHSWNGNDYDFAIVRYNTDGSLDNTFGADGIITTQIGALNEVANSIAIQSDGKMVVTGYYNNGNDNDIPIVRYNTDGTLDNTFGTNGIITTQIGIFHDRAYSIAIQNDGKIIAAGNSGNGSDDDFAVVRYNQNGFLDNTFGTGGIVTTPVGNSGGVARSVSIQSDGRIVLVGTSYNGNDNDFAIVRYNQNGALDNTFGTNGVLTTQVGTSDDRANTAAVLDDGKIIVAGRSDNGNKLDFAIVRYNSNGSLDNMFGTNGIVTTQVRTSSDYVTSVAIQDDGKIVAVGNSNNSDFDIAIVRYNPDGTLDNTFGSFGVVITPVGKSVSIAESVVIQNDGKVIAAGYSYNGSDDDFAVVRYNTDGSLDNTFGIGGIVTTPVGTSRDAASAVVLQSDGKIVAAGYSNNGNDYDIAIVRYNNNGFIDNTFGTNGVVTTQIDASDDRALSVVIQSDGKIVVAGYSNNGNDYDIAIARYNLDGTLDDTFGTNGIVTTDIGTGDNAASSIAIQNDGKIVAAGYSLNGVDANITIARYNTDGSLDDTFGTNGVVIAQTGTSEANSVALQNDEKIVVAGGVYDGFNSDFAIARFNTDGTLDNTFGTNGIVITQVVASDDFATSLAVQGDGKIVAAGRSWNGNGRDIAIARYNSNGMLDDSFGMNGVVTTHVGASYYCDANSVALQSSGEIVVAGYSNNENNNYYVFTVVRYTADPPTGINENGNREIPTNFALLQNYPNPFNPTTKIKIVIPKSSFVNLKVYDVLGKEVATLVNEEMPAGVYKVNFSTQGGYASGGDAFNLSSGIYFYRLQATPNGGQAGEFVQTKKMILLR